MTAHHRNQLGPESPEVALACGHGGRLRGGWKVGLVLGMAWMLSASDIVGARPATAEVPNSVTARDMARKRLTQQQQVRESAKRLVSEQLDLQMLQLRENGLDKLPLYAELAEMRANLDALVETHMQEVVAILDRLQADDSVDERELLGLAREKSREILVRLLMERQRLLRRLKMAELESQVQRLIERQTTVRDGTAALPGLTESARPVAAVNCREDQRDVAALYVQMTALLEDVAGWGAEIGREAADGLALLRQRQSEAELAAAVQSLADANWSAAVGHQNRAIQTFEELLERLRRASGLLERNEPAQRNAVLEKLAARQEELRRRTEAQAADPENADRLVEEQLGIQKELEKTAAKLPDAVRTPLDRAVAAAAQAAEQLFQANAAEAMQHQDQVLANIAEALSRTDDDPTSRSPDSAVTVSRDPMADLEQTAEALRRAREEQTRASESARRNELSEAADLERRIASEVASIPDGRELPEHVRSAVEEAAQKVGEAAHTLKEQGDESAADPSETISPNRSTGPRDPTAASADRPAPSSNDADGASTGDASEWSSSTPNPSAAAATRSAEQALEKALSVVETELADRARQRAASEVVAAAGEAFRAAANGMDSAPLFEQARQSARKLADVTARQLEQAQDAARAVEQHLNREPAASSEALRRLEEAGSVLLEAAAAQQRAAGRPQAAEAIVEAPNMQAAVAQAREAARAMAESDASPTGDVAGGEDRQSARQASDAPTPQSSADESPNQEDERRAAQSQVAEALGRARNSLSQAADSTESAEMAAALAAAQRASSAAGQAVAQWSASPAPEVPASVASLQRDAAEQIAAAAENVQEAMRRMEQAVLQELAQNRRAAQALVEKAIPVTPQATDSLHQAESAAASGMQPESGSAAAQEASRGKFLDAASAIAAREMQLKQALEAANRLPTLLTPEAVTPSGNQIASNDGSSESDAEPVSAALRAIQELAAGAANSSAVMDASATPKTPSRDNESGVSASALATSQSENRTDGASSNNRDAGRYPASQSTASQGRMGGETDSANRSEAESAGPIWMPNLPPEVRAAIRAAAESPPPPAYRERLRNYFKNVK
ncbi:MAG: hypothetical protein Kow0040_06550 [Thermogutta sp.]